MGIDRKLSVKNSHETGSLSFASLLKITRNSLGLSQSAFGKKLGLSKANVCDIEKGRHTVSMLMAVKIARKVGLPEKMALQACFQEQVQKAGFDVRVAVT